MNDKLRITGDNPSPAPLRRYPNWENALDEEGTDGQDETTLRPADLQSLIGENVPFTAATVWLNDGRECPAMIEMIDGVSGIQFFLNGKWFRIVRWLGQFGDFDRWEPYIEDWLPEDQRTSPPLLLSDETIFPLRSHLNYPIAEPPR